MPRQGATAEQGSGEFGMGGKGTRRDRCPCMRKMKVRVDSHFIIVFLKVIRVWRSRDQGPVKLTPHPFHSRLWTQTSTYD